MDWGGGGGGGTIACPRHHALMGPATSDQFSHWPD